MKIEKIKIIISIIAFVLIIIISLFFDKGKDEVFANFLAEAYKCIVVEKPLEKNINTSSFIYPCIDYDSNSMEVNINSQLFNKIITVGDTIEKNQSDSIILIRKKHHILKFSLSLFYDSNVDTLMFR